MNRDPIKIKRVLISVSDKHGVVEFAKGLHKFGVEIISTGGTAKKLQEEDIPVVLISNLTGFPEIMQGRVKTLHPKIFGAILGKRDEHLKDAKQHQIKWIDLVVCNLYPFAETIKQPNVTLDDALENIDIGGPSMLRSAAKNFGWVGVVSSPDDYDEILKELKTQKSLAFTTRENLAAKAFAHTAQYDSIIANYLNKDRLFLAFNKLNDLRYGENPHQQASIYRQENTHDTIIDAKQLQGKQLSYNNIIDMDAAVNCVKEFAHQSACVVIKHTNPCGVAENKDINQAFLNAWNADDQSAFGSIVALNKTCTTKIAEFLAKVFFEIIIAPDYEPKALEIFAAKKNLRVLKMPNILAPHEGLHLRYINGGLLTQTRDDKIITTQDLKVVTQKKPSETEIDDMLFGWKVIKHCKSNAIITVKNHTTLGIGPGQVSRIDAVKIALRKSKMGPHTGMTRRAPTRVGDDAPGMGEGAVLVSDAFFPFRDSIDFIADTGITAIIQPGGSIRDAEVIKACDEHNIAMIFTGIRCFNH